MPTDFATLLQKFTKSPMQHIVEQLRPGIETVKQGGVVVNDALKSVAAPGVDAVRRGVYSAVDLEPNDPNAYSRQADADLSASTKKLAAPTRQAIENVQTLLKSYLADTGKQKAPAKFEPIEVPEFTAVAADTLDPSIAPASTASAPVPGQVPAAPVKKSSVRSKGALAPAIDESASAGVVGALPREEPVVAAEQAAPEKSLMDMFRERMAEIPKAEIDHLTEKQRQQLQLQFFLSLAAHGGTPDSSFAENIGKAGLDSINSSRMLQNQNADRSMAQQKTAIDLLMSEATLGDKDRDNKARNKQLELQGQQIGMMREQIEQGKWKVHETAEGPIMYDIKTGETKRLRDASGRPIKLPGKDNEPSEVKLLRYLAGNPEMKSLYMELNPNKDKSGSLKEKDELDAAVKLLTDGAEQRTPQQARNDVRVLMGHPPGPTQAPPSAIEHLRKNPNLKEAFKQKYGYIPEGL